MAWRQISALGSMVSPFRVVRFLLDEPWPGILLALAAHGVREILASAGDILHIGGGGKLVTPGCFVGGVPRRGDGFGYHSGLNGVYYGSVGSYRI
jgi:hypothetical protein